MARKIVTYGEVRNKLILNKKTRKIRPNARAITRPSMIPKEDRWRMLPEKDEFNNGDF